MRCFHLLFHTGLRQPLCRALCSVRMLYLFSFIFSKYSFIRISREETKRPYSSSVMCSMSGLPTTKTLMPRGFLLTSISSNHITSFQIKFFSSVHVLYGSFVRAKPPAFRIRPSGKAFIVHSVEFGRAAKTVIRTQREITELFVLHDTDALRNDVPLGAVHVALFAIRLEQFLSHSDFLLFDIFSQRYSKSFLFLMRTYSQQ